MTETPALFDALPEGEHGIAVALERSLKASGFFTGGWTLEPPDSEDKPDNFGLAHDGELLYVIRVEPW